MSTFWCDRCDRACPDDPIAETPIGLLCEGCYGLWLDEQEEESVPPETAQP